MDCQPPLHHSSYLWIKFGGLNIQNLCYLDDVVVFSETFQSHMEDLHGVFDRFTSVGLKPNSKYVLLLNIHVHFQVIEYPRKIKHLHQIV